MSARLAMDKGSRRGWLTGVGVLALCLPCVLGPLAALGAGAILAALGGVVMGNLLLVAAGAALTLVMAAALLVRRRRRAATFCASSPPAAEPPAVQPLEIR